MSQLDWLAETPPYPLIVSSAGNNNDSSSIVVNYNMDGLIVGGGVTSNGQPGNRFSYNTPAGSWQNRPSPHGDRELPDLVAPFAYFTLTNTTSTGTSFSAPQVSAAAARLLSRTSALNGWPEGLRAILQATADQRVNYEVWHVGSTSAPVDLKGGTGLLNVDRAFQATKTQMTPGTTSNLTNGFALSTLLSGTRTSETYTVVVPSSGAYRPHLRVAVAFDAHPASSAGGADLLDADIDVYVVRASDSNPVTCSILNESYGSFSWDNSYEFVECHITNPDPANTYKIVVAASSFNDSGAWYGLAVAKDDWWGN